jgi:hypothetical protein
VRGWDCRPARHLPNSPERVRRGHSDAVDGNTDSLPMMRDEANGEAEQREEVSCGRQWAVQLSPKRRAWEVAQSRETLILRSAFRTSGPRTCSTPVAGHWHARWHSACAVVSSLRNALRGWPIAQCNSVHHSSVPAADFNSQGCQCTAAVAFIRSSWN